MAFLKDYYNEKFGVTIPKCYWKIKIENGIVGGKTNLRVKMNCFRNKKVADTNNDSLCDFDFDFIPDLRSKDNFIVQAYIYAKKLPQFKGAVDV
jgi:hypothetical protein